MCEARCAMREAGGARREARGKRREAGGERREAGGERRDVRLDSCRGVRRRNRGSMTQRQRFQNSRTSRENEMAGITTFRDLLAWQVGMETVVLTYQVTTDFPTDERFELVSQMHRASVSVPSKRGRRTSRTGASPSRLAHRASRLAHRASRLAHRTSRLATPPASRAPASDPPARHCPRECW
jgi:hypothetical protein